MLPAFCRDSVTVMRPGTREARGTAVADWASATEHAVDGCYLCCEAGSSDLDGRSNTSQPWSLYAPPGADVRFGDRVIWGGRAFEVAAPPEPRRDPCGTGMGHLKVPLVERRG